MCIFVFHTRKETSTKRSLNTANAPKKFIFKEFDTHLYTFVNYYFIYKNNDSQYDFQ
jgi:hypothetical protein